MHSLSLPPRVGIGVADAGRHDLNQHFAGLRSVEIDLVDLERPIGRDGNRGAALHGMSSLSRALGPPT